MNTLAVLLTLTSALLAATAPTATSGSGKSYTGWDCCKPACAWTQNLNGNTLTGQPLVCDINNTPLTNLKAALSAKSGCESGGTAYLCDNYSPFVNNNNVYGFVVGFQPSTDPATSCCKCFELTWTSGRARGKTMTVQQINIGEVKGTSSGDVTANDFVILTPGGGVGPNEAGCRNQYGTTWGKQYGGVANGSECGNLPQNLQGGCNWRFNWAGGDVNGWGINYKQVKCPQPLSSVSGCSA